MSDLDDLEGPALAGAIDAILSGDPRAAYDRLAPMLEATMDPRGARRAATILARIDDAIGVLSTDEDARPREAELIDPRWGDACDAFARKLGRADAIAIAEDIARGLAWLAGNLPREPAPIVDLDTGENGRGDFPLLVAGVVLGSAIDVVRSADWPKGIYRFSHPYGGHRCMQAMVIGFAVRPPEALWSAIEPFVEIGVNALGPADLATWTARIRTVMRFPELASGDEALLVSAPTRAEPWLQGAKILAWRPRTRPWHGISYFTDPKPEITETIPYSEAHDRALVRVAHSYSGAVPCLALLWGNSD